MRSYLGERDDLGHPIVWVVNDTPAPAVREINELLADLPALDHPDRTLADWPMRRADWITRKQELLARIEAADRPARRRLDHIEVHSPDGFEWGYRGDGPADLAHAILTNHLMVEPTDAVRLAFRDDVIAGLPIERFEVPASLVGAWVAANRELVDHELFLAPPEDSFGRAPSITHISPADLATPEVAGDPASASTVVAACEAAWRDIQSHHPELPDVVMVLGTGVERGRLVKLGHWWGGQWVADGQSRGEVLLAGEALHLEPARVFEVLLHEAAHGINAARGVKDTSRGGRYHNKEFARTAQQVLLRVRPSPPYGLAATELTPAAHERYASTIEHLGDAMRIARQLHAGLRIGADGGEIEGNGRSGQVGSEGGKDGQSKGPGSCSCGCGRKMRMAPSTLAAGAVLCGLCGSEFTAGAQKANGRPEREGPEADGGANSVLGRDDRDHDVLRRWNERRGTPDEQPMPAATAEEADRRSRMARSLLKADGTLHGPTLRAADGTEFQAGDRVHAVSDHADLPVGTLGTIERVDAENASVEVDFATWGRLQAILTDDLARNLRHDYAEVEAPEPEPVGQGIEL